LKDFYMFLDGLLGYWGESFSNVRNCGSFFSSLVGVALFPVLFPLVASGQSFNINTQQPVIRTFGVNTVVSVPDGGTMSLGGIHRSAEGRVSAGVPLLGNSPYVGPLFRNQAISRQSSAGQATVSVHIISLKELEQQVLQEAGRRVPGSLEVELNGNADVQRRAAFINRNIGRR